MSQTTLQSVIAWVLLDNMDTVPHEGRVQPAMFKVAPSRIADAFLVLMQDGFVDAARDMADATVIREINQHIQSALRNQERDPEFCVESLRAGAALVSEISWMLETDLRTMAAQQVNLKRGFL